MRAHASQQHRLLELQAVDTELGQVRHRLKTAASAVKVRQIEDRLRDAERQALDARTESEDLDRRVQRAEEELERVRARLARDRQLADQGLNARMQRELEHELGSLSRRLEALEDDELQMLERQEELAARVAALTAVHTDLAAELADGTRERDEEAAANRRREDELATQRAGLVAELPPELLRGYERARADSGTGAALLKDNKCLGCGLILPPNEVARLRAADPEQVEYCDECGCIIVRE